MPIPALFASIALSMCVNTYTHTYTNNAYVYEIDNASNSIVFEMTADSKYESLDGHLFEYEGVNTTIMPDDLVKVYMFDAFTPDITDDCIFMYKIIR